MHKHQASHHTDGTTNILATCYMCRTDTLLRVRTIDYQIWRSGVVIQDALPTLSAAERELFISGFCGDCFDRLVADEQ